MNDDIVAVIIPFFVIGLWFGIWLLWKVVRERRRTSLLRQSLQWQEVRGKVLQSQLAWAHIEIIYTYSTAKGEQFEGKYEISLPMVPFKNSSGVERSTDAARLALAEFPPGQEIVLRYNPQDMRQSVFVAKVNCPPAPSTGS